MANQLQLLNSLEKLESFFFQDLGKSYDSAFMEKRRIILKGSPKEESANPSDIKDTFKYEFASDQQEFSNRIILSASGKGSFGIGKLKASASLNNFFSSNSYSCYIFGFMRLIKSRFVFDLTETTIEPFLQEFMLRNQNNPDAIEKEIGDQVITSITLSSEIMIKLEIQTISETQKKEILSSTGLSGTFGSGQADFNSIISKIGNSKKILIDVYGDIPNDFLQDVSPQEADKLLLNFPKLSENKFSVLQFETSPVGDIPQLLNLNPITNLAELTQRKSFLTRLDLQYQDLIDWKNDILYVTSDANKDEFSIDTKTEALRDLIRCNKLLEERENLLKEVADFWKTNGRNSNKFELNLLDNFPDNFPIYRQVEKSKTIDVTPATPQASKPPRESTPHGGFDAPGHDFKN